MAEYKAISDFLITIWLDGIKSLMNDDRKKLREIETNWKTAIYETVENIKEEEVRKSNIGCLFGVIFRVIIGGLTGGYIIGAGDSLQRGFLAKGQARNIQDILNNNDMKTAIVKLREAGYDLPTDAFMIAYLNIEEKQANLEELCSVLDQAKGELTKKPELAEAFAKTYYSSQKASDDTKVSFTALFDALRKLNVQLISLPGRINRYIETGIYLNNSHKTRIRTWMESNKTDLSDSEADAPAI